MTMHEILGKGRWSQKTCKINFVNASKCEVKKFTWDYHLMSFQKSALVCKFVSVNFNYHKPHFDVKLFSPQQQHKDKQQQAIYTNNNNNWLKNNINSTSVATTTTSTQQQQ